MSARRDLRGRLAGLKWRFYWNARATWAYWRHGGAGALSAVGRRLRSDLRRDGFAIASCAELFGDEKVLAALEARVAELEAEQAPAIAAARALAGGRSQQKSFVWNVLGDRPRFSLGDPAVELALAPPLLAVVDAYFGLFAELRFFNVWRNFRTDAPPQRSQLWHRDREDRRILKVFVYLSDVGAGGGALVYAPGTHSAGANSSEPASFKEEGHGNPRSEDVQMAAVVPAEQWIEALGPRGTVVLCDTTGYHKGGLARTEDRLLYTCMYVSPAAECPISFEPDPTAARPAEPARRHAAAPGLGSVLRSRPS